MKQMIIIVFLFFALSLQLYGQEQMQDTSRINTFDLHVPSIYLDDDFDLNFPRLNTMDIYPDTGSVRLLSSYLLSSMIRDESFHLKSDIHLLTNYHHFYIENSRTNTFKQVLGMAQLSAVGYLAYKHIKKYGLR
jgi:hypothetical protein